ncbi:hypothetical protein [Miniphocaeibacter massiliensis]|uniref:hypothetical protein n=1 Tax=Miniphocaeibacter massiliensis TaxID=2041841 RepID=UPI000C1C2C7D|nr:hypothetical protein [Miniphocaeibacter massiliensis]
MKSFFENIKTDNRIQNFILLLNVYMILSFIFEIFLLVSPNTGEAMAFIPIRVKVIISVVINIVNVAFFKVKYDIFSTFIFIANMFICLSLLISIFVVFVIETGLLW